MSIPVAQGASERQQRTSSNVPLFTARTYIASARWAAVGKYSVQRKAKYEVSESHSCVFEHSSIGVCDAVSLRECSSGTA